eukprot:6204731-Pleurochrysis_carterae.AAC.1
MLLGGLAYPQCSPPTQRAGHAVSHILRRYPPDLPAAIRRTFTAILSKAAACRAGWPGDTAASHFEHICHSLVVPDAYVHEGVGTQQLCVPWRYGFVTLMLNIGNILKLFALPWQGNTHRIARPKNIGVYSFVIRNIAVASGQVT